MKTASVTITAKAGPGLAAVAQVFTGVESIEFQIARNVIQIDHDDVSSPSFFDYDNTATVTYVISGSNATITISS
jgi:hypothetical protein